MIKLTSLFLFTIAAAVSGPQMLPASLAPAASGDEAPAHDAARSVKASDLADGESRTLGSGDHAVTISRKGQIVTATHDDGENEELELSCRLDDDGCELTVTELGEGGRVLVSLTRKCESGEDDDECEDAEAVVLGGGSIELPGGLSWVQGDDDDASKRVIVRKLKGIGEGDSEIVVIGEDGKPLAEVLEENELLSGGEHAFKVFIKQEDEDCEGDCDHKRKVIVKALPGDVHVLHESGEEGHDLDQEHDFTWVTASSDGKTLLVCPKGDATLRVDSKEKDSEYLCPVHKLPLEPREPKVIRKKIEIRKKR